MTKLTEKQAAIITNIGNSDYGDGPGSWVWTFSAVSTRGEKATLGSLYRKGLAESDGGMGEDAACRLTETGIEAYYELNPEKRPTPPSDPTPPPRDEPVACPNDAEAPEAESCEATTEDATEGTTDAQGAIEPLRPGESWKDWARRPGPGRKSVEFDGVLLEIEEDGRVAGISDSPLTNPHRDYWSIMKDLRDKGHVCETETWEKGWKTRAYHVNVAPEPKPPEPKPTAPDRSPERSHIVSNIDLFDNSYHGPRWRYAPRSRPSGPGCQPKGFIYLADREHPKYRHGTLDYPRELTEKEVYDYELAFIEAIPARYDYGCSH